MKSTINYGCPPPQFRHSLQFLHRLHGTHTVAIVLRTLPQPHCYFETIPLWIEQALSTKESFQNSSAVVAESSLVSKDNGNSMRSMQSMEELKRVPKLRRWTSIVVLYFTMVDFMSSMIDDNYE